MPALPKARLVPLGSGGAPADPTTGLGLPRLRHGRRAIVALGTYLLLLTACQVLEWPSGNRAFFADLFFLPVETAAVVAAWAASNRCAGIPRLHAFWRLFACAVAAQMAGDVAMAIYDSGSAEVPYPSLADPLYLGFYLLMALALLLVPVAPATLAQRERIGLDLATAILGGSMAIWYLVLAPTVVEGGNSTLQMATSIAYPIGDVGILAGLAIVALRWSPATLRRPLALIAIGVSLFIVADLAYGYVELHGGISGSDPLDGLWIAAIGLFAIAAMQQSRVEPGDEETLIPTRAPIERRVSWLPFGALLIGSITVLSSQWGTRFVPELSLLLIAIALAALVAVRQYVTQGEMIRLEAELRGTHDELAHLASYDPLTGMANRRCLDEKLGDELTRARRYGRPLSILFIDIDRFKSINDLLGHKAGDAALREFAAVLEAQLRPADIAARWGGEEFVIVLPETANEEARATAERLRATVEDNAFDYAEGSRITCSIGVASFPGEAMDAAGLLGRADSATYAAKRNGRNQVVAAAELSEAALAGDGDS
jgi:diguanylate cyclase (GGDEF)-like protein